MDHIRDTADYLKGVSIGAGVLIVLAAICFGISVAMGADITSMTQTTQPSLVEMFGFLFLLVAMFLGTLAALCTMMSILVALVIAFSSAALPFTSRDQSECEEQEPADYMRSWEARERRTRL
ncbi:MAG: hypothetical protein ABIR91_05435 [Candidatus Saccharimonadales bacterium]